MSGLFSLNPVVVFEYAKDQEVNKIQLLELLNGILGEVNDKRAKSL